MTNQLYPKGREGFLGGDIAWDTDTIKVVALDNTYTFSTAHDFLDDVGAGTRVATSGAFASKTITEGVADAADVTLSAVAAGDTITQLVIFQDTGTEATSRLIAFIDTKSDASAISVATNGGDIDIVWDSGSSKIFKL